MTRKIQRTHTSLRQSENCIELIDPNFPIVVRGSCEDHEEYWERELKKWEEVLYVHWEWKRTGFYAQSQQDDAA